MLFEKEKRIAYQSDEKEKRSTGGGFASLLSAVIRLPGFVFFTEFRRFQRAPNENDHRIRSKKEETRKMRNDLRVLVDVFFFYLE